jgi:tellurite resistance protein TerC
VPPVSCRRVLAAIPHWHWTGFAAFVLLALAADLGVFHRDGRRIGFREAMFWTALWAVSAFVFALVIAPRFISWWRPTDSATFVTGYLVELSLSMDNVFVIALIFHYFAVPPAWQHRVLFWGILGALVLRGLLIVAGAAVIAQFHWVLYIMGVFLIYTGCKMFSAGDDHEPVEPEKNPAVRLVRRFFPMTDRFDGERLVTHADGRRLLTPLALVLVMVETTDVVFALDSIPAIFGVTHNAYLVFTSNIFAILGLRSLYFVLASALGCFRFLKYGLSLVLVFIGAKMLAERWLKAWLGDSLMHTSLGVVLGIIMASIIASLVLAWVERRRKGGAGR